MSIDSYSIFDQNYLQQLKEQAPVKYVCAKYTEQQAHVVAEEFWRLFQSNVADVMSTLFGIKPDKLTVGNTHTMRSEYHAVYEVKRGCHKWVNYNISSTHTENVEYGYQDYSGKWHHAYTVPEVSYDSESSGGMASCDVYDQGFYARKTDSPILHRWIAPNEKNTFDCSRYTAPTDSKPYNFNGSIVRPAEPNWNTLIELSKGHLAREVRSQLQQGVKYGTVGFYDNVVTDDSTVEKRILLWPFYFADFKVNEHTFTVRLDAVNGFVNLYLDNPDSLETEADQTNERLQNVERQERNRENRERREYKNMRESGIDEDKLGMVSLVCGIISIFIPVLAAIVSIIFGVRALKFSEEGRGKAIAGIVISVLSILMYAIYFIGGLIIQLNDPDALARLITLSFC